MEDYNSNTFSSESIESDENEIYYIMDYLDTPQKYVFVDDGEEEITFIDFVKKANISDIVEYLTNECLPGWFELTIDGNIYTNIDCSYVMDDYKETQYKDGCYLWFNGEIDEYSIKDFSCLNLITTENVATLIKDSVDNGLDVSLFFLY